MEKKIPQSVVPAFPKTEIYNRAFYKKHISGECKTNKSTNHVGNFDKVRYHRVLHKTIKKKPHKKIRKLELEPGQASYITKNVTVREFGAYKAGLIEQNLSFEVAGRDGPGGGVIPEHLHRHFWKLTITNEARDKGTEKVCSQGGTEYVIEKNPKPYEGFREEATAEERNSDCSLFQMEGQPNWDDEEMDCQWPKL